MNLFPDMITNKVNDDYIRITVPTLMQGGVAGVVRPGLVLKLKMSDQPEPVKELVATMKPKPSLVY